MLWEIPFQKANQIPLPASLKPFNGSGHLSPGLCLSIPCPSWDPYCPTCPVAELWSFPSIKVQYHFKDKIIFTFFLELSFSDCTQGWLLQSHPFALSKSPRVPLSGCEYSGFYPSAASFLRAVNTHGSQPLAQHQAWSQYLILLRRSWPFNLSLGSLLWKYGTAKVWEEALSFANMKELLNEERQTGGDGRMTQGFGGRMWLE